MRRDRLTLLELVTVVTIIGSVAMVAIPRFASALDQARQASIRTDVRNAMTSQAAP